MGRVLIAGCGYVGSALGRRLLQAGHEVWALRRRTERLEPGLHRVQADLTAPDSLVALDQPFDGVAYTAAADETSDDAYRRAYVVGLQNLQAVPAVRAAKRFVFTSSTAVYAQTDGEWVDEASPTEPRHFSGTRLLEAEALVHERGGTVLRLSGIYGAERASLIDSVKAGRATYARGQPSYTNRIHRDDCAGALFHLLQMDDPSPLYIGCDDEPAERREVLSWLAEQLDAPPPQAVDELPSGRGSRSNKRCKNTRLRASGFALAYPSFRDGYAAILAER